MSATAPRATVRPRLPLTVGACLFDLDGVLTDTASLHAQAWKQTFDAFLRARPGPFVPFGVDSEYAQYVDGRQRSDGVRTFLAARGIELPEGTPDDPPDLGTIHGLGNRKNALVLQLIAARGAVPFADAVQFVRAVRAAGIATAVVSASANCSAVLEAAALSDLFDARIDASVAAALGLRSKPQPDMFLAGARALGSRPAATAVVEDAIAGVEAGHAGGFTPVIGVARRLAPELLREHGADIVVQDLTELLEAA
jgi:beta-phosphoglucomutase family hydrolase